MADLFRLRIWKNKDIKRWDAVWLPSEFYHKGMNFPEVTLYVIVKETGVGNK